MTEFEKYDDTEDLQEPVYFLFSGAAGYFEIVKFIIDSFNLIENSKAQLYLAIKGDEEHLKKILTYINCNPGKDKSKIILNINGKTIV